ncbi:MAG: TIGR04283 family arsenosugar biosynthesis glycosyltransferase [Pseudomonadota bacterium]
MSPEHKLTILIPTLNAAVSLGLLLGDLARELPSCPIVLADGGSSDATQALARTQDGVTMITTMPGRGRQLLAGAATLTEGWLLVLHADSRLAAGFGAFIHDHMNMVADQVGVARLRFDTNDWRASLIAAGANWRTKWLGLPYGDQGLLISMPTYQAIGGFTDVPLMEDVLLIRALKQAGFRIRLLPTTITTSAARYQRDGYLARVWLNLSCLFDFWRGVPPDQLVLRYERRGPD